MNTKSIYLLKILVAILVGSSFVITALIVDKKSISDAENRESQLIPDANDPNTWALQRPHNYNNEQQSDLSFVSSTITYPLTYENISNGKIAIAGLPIEFGEGNIGSENLGYILFSNGLASSCYPYDGSSACVYFNKEMFKIHDVITSPTSISSEENILPDGFVIFKYNTKIGEKLFLASLHTNKNNIYGIREMTELDLSANNKYLLDYKGLESPFPNVYYYHLGVKSVDIEKEFNFEVLPIRNGPAYRFTKRNGNVLHIEFEDNSFDYSQNEAKVTKLGMLSVSHNLSDFWLNQFYFNESSLFQWDSGTDKGGVMYHKDACGLPYSFSDMSVNIDGSKLPIQLKVSVPRNKTFYNLTTARYGYNPEQWGKVIGVVNVENYRNEIINSISFNGYATEPLLIAGKSVRHTLPFKPPRPCEGVFEQYQWVRDGNIYTLGFSYGSDVVLTNIQHNFINRTLETLVASANYVPTSASVE